MLECVRGLFPKKIGPIYDKASSPVLENYPLTEHYFLWRHQRLHADN